MFGGFFYLLNNERLFIFQAITDLAIDNACVYGVLNVTVRIADI